MSAKIQILKMIDYILLAEFDDLKGKVIRYSYPSKIQSEEENNGNIEDRIAENIIPDTGNDRMIDTCFFMVNRPSVNQIS